MTNLFYEAILKERPDLAEQDAVLLQPPYPHVIEIGHEIFKLNKGKELEFLRWIENKGLPVPKVLYASERGNFFSITRIPGVELNYTKLTTFEENRLAVDLADFCVRLSDIFPQTAPDKVMFQDDFHGQNILVDPQTKRLTGVIDFQGIVGGASVAVKTDTIQVRYCKDNKDTLRNAFRKAFIHHLKKSPAWERDKNKALLKRGFA